jgi:predicted RNA-binding Zn-ribbon protein involved in translation (DUF1610 family)
MDDGAVFIASDPHRAVRSLAAKVGFCDPEHRGELATVFDGRGRQIRYLRPNGVSLDAFGEILLDHGVTSLRLTPNEVLQLLGATFDSKGRSVPARKEPSARAIMKAVAKAQRNRQMKFVCPECGQIARGSRNVLLDCGLCWDMRSVTVRMVRADPLPGEIAVQLAKGK